MKIKKIALMGAGAVGSYIIWGLAQLQDVQWGVIAEGARAERLRKNGCMINDRLYMPQVWTPAEAQDADLLVIALKYGALPAALPAIKTATGTGTTVMSLMNGVDSEEIIGSVISKGNILYSLIKVASHRTEQGVRFNPDTTIGIVFGELAAPYESDRVLAIEELFKQCGIHIRHTDCIREEIWSKFRLNVCNNLPQAILGVGVGCYRDSAHMQTIQEGLRKELHAIAAAKGIDFNKIAASSTHGSAVAPSARYSTLQDIDAGRHTEIDMFAGALMKMGAKLGIPTPYNEYTYHMIKALEEKNDGLFNYDGRENEVTSSK